MDIISIKTRDGGYIYMEAQECIKTRRSVRRFTEQTVTKEQIMKVIDLAMYSPSWKNVQSTRYIVVTDQEKKQMLASEGLMGYEDNKRIIENASALVIVTTVDARSGYERDGSFSTSKGKHWQSFDAGIAAQTFCLGAHTMGLGTVILGIFDEEVIKTIMIIPEGESVSALIPIGYPNESPTMPRRKEIDKMVRWE